MNWKTNNLCLCSFKRNIENVQKWINERPDFEDSPSPCYFCIIATNPKLFEMEWNVKIEDLADVYCSKCQIPKTKNDKCLQPACK